MPFTARGLDGCLIAGEVALVFDLPRDVVDQAEAGDSTVLDRFVVPIGNNSYSLENGAKGLLVDPHRKEGGVSGIHSKVFTEGASKS